MKRQGILGISFLASTMSAYSLEKRLRIRYLTQAQVCDFPFQACWYQPLTMQLILDFTASQSLLNSMLPTHVVSKLLGHADNEESTTSRSTNESSNGVTMTGRFSGCWDAKCSIVFLISILSCGSFQQQHWRSSLAAHSTHHHPNRQCECYADRAEAVRFGQQQSQSCCYHEPTQG